MQALFACRCKSEDHGYTHHKTGVSKMITALQTALTTRQQR